MQILMPSSWSQRSLAAILFALLFCAYAYRIPDGGWNQNCRLDAVHAFYQGDRFRIDAYQSNTGDKAFHDGHWYCDKAPGGILFALPAFGIGTVALGAIEIDVESAAGWRAGSWFATAGSAGFLTALGGIAMFLLLCEWVGRKRAFLTTIFLFLGSLPFPYATMLFSHGITAGLLSMALWSCLRRRMKVRAGFPLPDLLTGFLCGLAVITEYPTIIGGAAIFIFTARRGWKSAGAFVLGAVPPALLLMGYLYICFGSVLYTTYAYSVFVVPETGVYAGFNTPTWEHISYILLGNERGLFVWCPVLILAIGGIARLWDRSRWLAIAIGGTIAAQILFASALVPLNGGWAVGPRHLTQAIPFFALPVALACARLPLFGTLLGVSSMLLMGIAVLISPLAPEYGIAPLRDFYIPKMLSEQWGLNLGSIVGLHHTWSVAPLVLLMAAALWIGLVCEPRAGTKRKNAH